jgi:hypothetical protein
MKNRHMRIFRERMHPRSANQLIAAWDAATPEERTEFHLLRHYQIVSEWHRWDPPFDIAPADREQDMP